MKRFLLVIAVIVSLGSASSAFAGDAKAELEELLSKIRIKLQAGKDSEQGLADELKALDMLLVEHKNEKTDDVAHILVIKATLYAGVFHENAKATPLLNQVKAQFPDTTWAKKVDDMLQSFAKTDEANKIQRGLTAGTQFPDFAEKDLDGKPLTIVSYKGKIVMIDFWATWCGPCVHELPNVIKAYEKYHGQGFEIIGVSLDSEKAKLTDFIKEKNMPWPQYFDGLGWKNKLGVKYGVHSIPASYLLDKEGKIIANGLRGPALEIAIGKALAEK